MYSESEKNFMNENKWVAMQDTNLEELALVIFGQAEVTLASGFYQLMRSTYRKILTIQLLT